MKLTDHHIDAIITFTGIADIDSAFIGDQAFSPMLRALRFLRGNEVIRRIHLDLRGVELPDFLKPEVVNAGATLLTTVAATEPVTNWPAMQTLSRWNPWRTLWGPMAVTEFCATIDAPRISAIHEELREEPDALVIVSATMGLPTSEMLASVLDAAIAGNVRENYTIADAPRGLVAPLIRPGALRELSVLGVGIGISPWRTRGIIPKLLAATPASVRTLRRSFSLADSATRSFVRQVALSFGEEANDVGLDAFAARARELTDAWRGESPRVVELEITSRRPFDPTWLPAPQVKDQDLPLEVIEKLAEQLSPDTTLLTLGGFGDALMHPKLFEALDILRPRVAGLAIRTFGESLDGELIEKLGEAGVEIINLRFGQWGEELSAKANNGHDHSPAIKRIFDYQVSRHENTRAWCYPLPLLVPEVIKSFEGDKTLLHFLEAWYECRAWPIVTSVNHYDGAVEGNQALLPRPGQRGPCMRLEGQMWIRSNGDAVLCQQHHDGPAIGNIATDSIANIWRGGTCSSAWKHYLAGEYDQASERCVGCTEWYRLT